MSEEFAKMVMKTDEDMERIGKYLISKEPITSAATVGVIVFSWLFLNVFF